MLIITLSHQKGGVGKSTIALNLAYMFNQNGLNSAIFDTDPQGSINETNPPEIDIIPAGSDTDILKSLDYDIIIIDTPPYFSNTLPRIYAISDLIIIPNKPGVYEGASMDKLINIINRSKADNPYLKAYILFNMVKHNSKMLKDTHDFISDGLPAFKSVIIDRVIYGRSLISGGAISDPKAKKELTNLVNEIINILT